VLLLVFIELYSSKRSDLAGVILSPFERTVARRYLRPGRGEAFIAMVAGISLVAVALGVAALIIVMSVMNGFRAELFDKIVGLNGHAVIQGYGGRLDDWQAIVKDAQTTPGVVQVSPMIEQPLLGSLNGRVSAVVVRGQTAGDIAHMAPKVVAGSMADVKPDAGTVAIGKQLAEDLGAQVGDSITIVNPAGLSTPLARPRVRSAIRWRPSSKSASMISTRPLSSCRCRTRRRCC
jgi:lipoprotein-releasing system permease protein